MDSNKLLRSGTHYFRCDDKRLGKILYSLWGVAIVLEGMVQANFFGILESIFGIDIPFPILLSSDYLGACFGAICTVAVLGNAILSILFSANDRKTLGVPFQDVMNYSVTGKEQRFTINVLTLSIILAIFWFVFEFYNLLFAVLIQDVLLLLFSYNSIWGFQSNKEKQKQIITEIIREADPSRFAVYVDNWFEEINNALVPNNMEEIREYVELIRLVIDSSFQSEQKIRSNIGRHLQDYFNTACDRLGFSEAYELLLAVSKFGPEDDRLDAKIALKYLERLRVRDQLDMVDCDVKELIEGLFEGDHFDSSDKALFAYQYFVAVFDNSQMNPSTKTKQIDRILRFFCDMDETSSGEIKAKVITNIVKYNILDNPDVEVRKRLFCSLIEALNARKYSASDKFYIATISEIFRAFYFSIYLEEGSLTESYREKLLQLFHSVTDEKDRIPLTFMTLIHDRLSDVIHWLAVNGMSFIDRPRPFWEYRSPAMNWKRMVWTMEEVVTFAFCIYQSIGSNIDGHPFVGILESKEFTDEEKCGVCKVLLDQYSEDGFATLTLRRIEQVFEFCNITAGNQAMVWDLEHVYYQDKYIQLSTAMNLKCFSESAMTNQDVFEAVRDLYGQNQIFKFDSNLSLFPGKRYLFEPTYEWLNKYFWKNVPQRVKDKIWKYLNSYVGSELPSIGINFQLEGINTLIEALQSGEYQYRNYRYTDDMSFRPEVRNSKEFQRLSDIMKDIPHDSRSQLGGHVFLKQANIPINFLVQYELCDLSQTQCEEYIQLLRKDGMYEIGGYKFDYDHAIKYALDNLKFEKLAIFIHVGVEPDSGFRVHRVHLER